MTGRIDTRPGWSEDDHAAALRSFLRHDGHALHDEGRTAADASSFFANRFTPREIGTHFTGYYEPELTGSADPGPEFPVPIHAPPPGGCGAPRKDIDHDDLLAGYEIAWLRDAVDRFFLQVQGSGRIRMDGQTLRVSHAEKNGHPYTSIGRILVDRGEMDADTITADAVKAWLREDPERAREVMWQNASYIMFRVLRSHADEGPPGTLGCPVTALRSLAVDPEVVPLGTPVWIEIDAPQPIRRLVIAQDTGSAIRGARADLFFGTGDEAGLAAGALNHPGRMFALDPA